MNRAVIGVLLLGALLLSGCATAEDRTSYVEIDTPNGPVPCIVYGGSRGGISCDWSGNEIR